MQLEQERRACRGLGCKDAESKSQQGQLGGELSRQELSEVSEREDKVNRLTDDKTAAALKENIEKLKAAGIEVDASNERYVRLADYERMNEQMNRCGARITLDADKMLKDLVNTVLDDYEYKGKAIREWVEKIIEMDGGEQE